MLGIHRLLFRYYNPSTLISRIKFLVISLLDEAKTEPPVPKKEDGDESELHLPNYDLPDANDPTLVGEDGSKLLSADILTGKAVSSQGCSRVFILKGK